LNILPLGKSSVILQEAHICDITSIIFSKPTFHTPFCSVATNFFKVKEADV
jgi:hypothetical protein